MEQDRNFEWARRRIFRGAQQFATLVSGAAGPISSEAGATILVEIGSSGLGGYKCQATADLVQDMFPIPSDLDTEKKTYWRVYWTTDTTKITKKFTPTMKYTVISNASDIAAAGTAFTSNPAADTSQGANKLHVTGWGYLTSHILTGGKMANIGIQAKGTCVTKDVWIIGYEVEYTPHACASEVGRMAMEYDRHLDY